MDKLLNFLQKHGHSELPSTACTLLQTPGEVNTQQVPRIDSIYFPPHEKLPETLETYPGKEVAVLHNIGTSLNIHGVPLFKSS